MFAELFEGLLAPDEVAFAVLLRGYGTTSERPQWSEISTTLQQMECKHGIQPSTSGCAAACACLRHCASGSFMTIGVRVATLPPASSSPSVCCSHLQCTAGVLHQAQR